MTIRWQPYTLVRNKETDKSTEQVMEGVIIEADDKVEAQLIAGALFGSHAFVCSQLSSKYHVPINV